MILAAIVFHADGPNAVAIERIAIIFGITTLVLALLTFTSCRTCVSFLKRLGLEKITDNRVYHTFYRYHAYYWWLFGIVLLSHLMMAVIHSGWPQADDADVGLQWASLLVGFTNLGLAGTLFFSCRISPKLLSMANLGNSLKNRGFRRFFEHHGLYWSIFILVIAGHIAAGYLHAGLWPG